MGDIFFSTHALCLINVGSTFQMEMDIFLIGIIGQSVVVYLDYVTIFPKKRSNHLHHLKKIFEHCRKCKISLNPKKSIFAVFEGNILGNIIAKSGILVDPKNFKTITQIPHPNDKKVMLSFLGKIIFLCKFISDSSQIVKPLQNMIKKDVVFKRNQEEEDFNLIKKAIIESPDLYRPNFNKDYMLYTFASDSSLIIELTQKDDQRDEWPISFMSIVL